MWKRKKQSDDDPFAPGYLEQREATVAASGPFKFTVDQVFKITGRGTAATGTISKGQVSPGESVRVMRQGHLVHETTVTGVEHLRKRVKVAQAGDQVGVLVPLDASQLFPGDSLVKDQ